MFYIAFGAAAGVLVVRQVSRAAANLSPQSMAGSLVQSVQEFVADVREGMAEREEEIRDALGLDDDDVDGPAEATSTPNGRLDEPVDALAPVVGQPLPRRRRH
jgi:hypothetical protein